VERAAGIGGVFVRSAQPDRLRAWYAEHLGIDIEDWGGTVFVAGEGQSLVCGNRFELWQPVDGQ
jgi:hypothetical protein